VANGVQNGFALQNSSGGFLFSFYFQGGGSDYAFYDANGATTTSVGYTVTGLRIQVIVGEGSPAAYSLLITPCGGSTVEYSGTFAGTNGPAQVVLFNNNPYGGGDNDLYFNSMFAGLAYDSADDYSGGWSGQDAGDAAPISGATNASFVTSSGNNGDLYYAVAYNGAGYAVSTPAQLTVNPLPTVSVNSGTICAGDSEMLTATTSAANPSYLWSPGGSTNASITVSPASTTTYTVSVTDGTTGCMNGGSGTVTVNPLPMVSVNSAVVCAGDVATLTATTSSTNASYLWSPGGSTNASIMVSPSSTTMYTVTVTDQTTGCMNSGSGTVTVNPLPMVSVNSPVICAGATATLTATTSASNPSYLWSPGGATSASIMVSPSATANYMVTVTDGTTGCMNSGSGTVTVNPLPAIVLGASPTVAYGSTNASLTYGSPTGSPDQYSIIYDSTALAAGFTNVPATVLPASPITLVIPVDVGTNVFNGILVVDDSATGCGSTNYAFTITVSALPVQLTGTRPYDGTKDANASILTIINDLDGTNLTLAGSGLLAGSGVGLEPIADFTGLSLGGSAATNYTLAGASGSVTVSTVPLTITADAQTNTYGSTLILGNSAFMVGSGLVGTEMVTGVTLTANGGTAANSPVAGSPYTITPSAATGINGFLAANYAINYVTNSLTVNPLVVVLTGTRPYDGTATAASGVLSVSNAVGGDDVDLASGSATLAGSAVGLEPITSIGSLMLGGTTAPDYTLAGATGAVTVTNPHLPYSFIAASFDNVGTNIVMVWTSVPGVVYQVLGSGSASAPLNTWTNVGSPITATSTLTTNIVNASSAAAYFDITSH